ncbi:hypothetical protein HAX54_051513 [Datura stramonium]|uniref:Uncharacterized protein n=1 Tax=Datura stramonium TaxID=4076 RepID=A0ABS8SXT0_DATST|nr:hypothetical protein [Datura stramonium]
MNVLASQVEAQQLTKETNVSAPQSIMDEGIFGWDMEEEIVEETFVTLYLRGEELEERGCTSRKTRIGHDCRYISGTPMKKRQAPPSHRQCTRM